MHRMSRFLSCAVVALACIPAGRSVAAEVAPASVSVVEPAERLSFDTQEQTTFGNTFIAPAGWTVRLRNGAAVLEPPESGSFLALIDVHAKDADSAVATAWSAIGIDQKRTLRVVTDIPDRDGWRGRRSYDYLTSPNEHRSVRADARRVNDVWTVVLVDMAEDIGEKRSSQIALIVGKLLPKGYARENFAGKQANPLNASRIAELQRFVRDAMKETGVPGVSLGLIQDGKVVYAGGLGVRELGKSTPVDADTRFMVASNTKALVTLMLARLVDQHKINWEQPVSMLWPAFRLGNDETTRKVLVKHLICACTGMPRQDMEWLLEFGDLTPAKAMEVLGTMQPTSSFGELFQYSNPMAAAAGYLAGHTLYPDQELGAAFDRAMQELVFDPLGMHDTTLDFVAARKGNVALPHAPDVDGHVSHALERANDSVVPVRPAGGIWSTTNDMLKYVAMELAEGKLPDGSRLVSSQALLARRAPQVAVGTNVTYGMALMVDTVYGTPVIHHGGDMIGFHSDMMWLPEQGVGAVILTNGDPGWLIRGVFRRKLLEVLFDGRAEADAQMAGLAKAFHDEMTGDRRLLTLPPDPKVVATLAPQYDNPAVGNVTVIRNAGSTVFDFGEWSSEVATKANPDGSVSTVTLVPGFSGLEFVVGRQGDRRTLTMRDGQHVYVLVEH
jgi:CubicO group peptidase (beta-lactamase class C family)